MQLLNCTLFAYLARFYGSFTSLEIMGKTFENIATSESSCEHDALMILLPFGNWSQILIRVAQLVTYGLLVARMNMVEHESFTQYKE